MTVDVVWEEFHYRQDEVLSLIQKHLENAVFDYEIVDSENVLMPSGSFARGIFFNKGMRDYGCVISAAARFNFISPSFPKRLKRQIMKELASPKLRMHLLS